MTIITLLPLAEDVKAETLSEKYSRNIFESNLKIIFLLTSELKENNLDYIQIGGGIYMITFREIIHKYDSMIFNRCND